MLNINIGRFWQRYKSQKTTSKALLLFLFLIAVNYAIGSILTELGYNMIVDKLFIPSFFLLCLGLFLITSIVILTQASKYYNKLSKLHRINIGAITTLVIIIAVLISLNRIFDKKNNNVTRSVENHNTTDTYNVNNTNKSANEDSTISKEIQQPRHGYQAEPIVKIKYDNYFVSGSDRKTICKQLYSGQYKDGAPALAYVIPDIRTNFTHIETGEGFTVGTFSVTVDILMVLPQWESSGGASNDVKNDWRKFKDAVKVHEETHKDIAINHSDMLVQEINNLGYYKTAPEFSEAISNIYNNIQAKHKESQYSFDVVDTPKVNVLKKELCVN